MSDFVMLLVVTASSLLCALLFGNVRKLGRRIESLEEWADARDEEWEREES